MPIFAENLVSHSWTGLDQQDQSIGAQWRLKWMLGTNCCVAFSSLVSLIWLFLLVITSDSRSGDSLCGWYVVRDELRLGKWFDAPSEGFFEVGIGAVCERLAASDCLAPWVTFDGSCYLMVCESRMYREAARECRARNAHLVHIGSARENDHVQRLCGRSACWIGLFEPFGSENWMWEDGENLGTLGNFSGFSNWAVGQPNNPGGRDDNAALMNGAKRRNMHGINSRFLLVSLIARIVVPTGLSIYVCFMFRRRSFAYARCVRAVKLAVTCALVLDSGFIAGRAMHAGLWEDVSAFFIFLSILSCLQACLCAHSYWHIWKAELCWIWQAQSFRAEYAFHGTGIDVDADRQIDQVPHGQSQVPTLQQGGVQRAVVLGQLVA